MKVVALAALLMPLLSWAGEDQDQIHLILKDIERGWEQADGQPFRTHFLDSPDARYFESGGQNEGLDDLVDHHVVPEGKSLKLELDFGNVQINIHSGLAWVLADTEIKGSFTNSNRTIHNRGFQTFVLRKIDGNWKVLHTHSSSRPVKPKS